MVTSVFKGQDTGFNTQELRRSFISIPCGLCSLGVTCKDPQAESQISLQHALFTGDVTHTSTSMATKNPLGTALIDDLPPEDPRPIPSSSGYAPPPVSYAPPPRRNFIAAFLQQHVIVLYLMSFVGFVIACSAMSKVNGIAANRNGNGPKPGPDGRGKGGGYRDDYRRRDERGHRRTEGQRALVEDDRPVLEEKLEHRFEHCDRRDRAAARLLF